MSLHSTKGAGWAGVVVDACMADLHSKGEAASDSQAADAGLWLEECTAQDKVTRWKPELSLTADYQA